MIFVFDLDRTLLHTSQQEKDSQAFVEKFGIERSAWKKALDDATHRSIPFDPWKLFSELKKKGATTRSLEEFKKGYGELLNFSKYKHTGLEKLLQSLDPEKNILLTFGVKWYQQTKVKSLGLEKHFKEIHYTLTSKEQVIAKIQKKYPHERLVFIDDSNHYLELTKIYLPEVFLIQAQFACCGVTKKSVFADVVITSLPELQKKLHADVSTFVPKIDVKNFGVENTALMAASMLKRKKIISVPTETSYGLAADATSREAVSQIYKIKDRDESKRIPFMVRDRAQLKKYVKLSKQQEKWLQKYENKTVSFLMPKTKGKLDLVGGVGRKATHPFLRELAKNFNNPFTITSTNISGQPSIYKFEEYQEQFKGHNQQVDAFFDYGTLKANPASTILDITQNPPAVLRQGKTKINVKESFSSKSHKKTS